MSALSTKPVPRRGRRRLWLVRTTIGVTALAVALVGLDIAARIVTQNRLAGQVRSATAAGQTTVQVRGFAFLLPLLASGSIAGVEVTARHVPVGTMDLNRVSIEAYRVRVDRHELLTRHEVKVAAIARALITVEITSAEISSLIGYPVIVSAGNRLSVPVNGATIPAEVRVTNGDVFTVSAAGSILGSVDLTLSHLVPGCHMTTTIGPRAVSLRCEAVPVPAALIEALSAGTSASP